MTNLSKQSLKNLLPAKVDFVELDELDEAVRKEKTNRPFSGRKPTVSSS